MRNLAILLLDSHRKHCYFLAIILQPCHRVGNTCGETVGEAMCSPSLERSWSLCVSHSHGLPLLWSLHIILSCTHKAHSVSLYLLSYSRPDHPSPTLTLCHCLSLWVLRLTLWREHPSPTLTLCPWSTWFCILQADLFSYSLEPLCPLYIPKT